MNYFSAIICCEFLPLTKFGFGSGSQWLAASASHLPENPPLNASEGVKFQSSLATTSSFECAYLSPFPRRFQESSTSNLLLDRILFSEHSSLHKTCTRRRYRGEDVAFTCIASTER
jgi:hypothetical protein